MLRNYIVKALRPPGLDETPLSSSEVLYARNRGLVLSPRAVLVGKAQARYDRRRAFRGFPERSQK